jgi:hypothetical protein
MEAAGTNSFQLHNADGLDKDPADVVNSSTMTRQGNAARAGGTAGSFVDPSCLEDIDCRPRARSV